jgi:hypothetical protein
MSYYKIQQDKILSRKGMSLIQYKNLEEAITMHFRWCKNAQTANKWIEKNKNKVSVERVHHNVQTDAVKIAW